MSNIDKRGLREAAEKATKGRWAVEFDDEIYSTDGVNHEQIAMVFSENEARDAAFIAAANPATVLALLDELERNQQYIKRRDQENEEIALTVGKLLIENGRLVADTLRHLADNEIDSDYFAITSTNENGTEIDHEMAITDYALQAAGTVDELVAALESAEKRIAELEAKLDSADKLQDSAFRHGLQHGFSLGQTDNQAGFEECLSAYGTGKGE
ncbi:TPA: ead/Ea22-like family protein [Escherichia coli]|nr:hypothetical protein ECTOK1_C12370 [Escherichia coli]HDV3243009.1 ead/Ea22-like family protein [Escherichia coli]HDV3792467.1 ead/Ea22-like family protein [Escherichia coli]HDV3812360.1 ead/Ea22-like family protein [Escherichia coli]HDV3854137.1 ead/Ea22-like family protein [Escherichia coli]